MRQWNVRENQNGSSLTHYGVKGMRWGVRKDKETSGSRSSGNKNQKKTFTAEELVAGHPGERYDPNDIKKSDFSQAMSVIITLRTRLAEDKAFVEYLDKNGHKDYSNKVDRMFDIMLDESTNRDDYVKDAKELYDIWVKYNSNPEEHLSEDDKTLMEIRYTMGNKLMDYLEENGIVLRDNQEIIPVCEFTNGELLCYYQYKRGDGKTYRAELDEIEDLMEVISKDSERLKDFRNTSKAKTREKNISTSNKVTIKKGKKVNTEGKVGKGDTYLSSKSDRQEIIRTVMSRKSLYTAGNMSTSQMIKFNKAVVEYGKRSMAATAYKKSLKKKVSDLKKKSSKMMETAYNFVKDFLKNPHNIQPKEMKTTRW